MMRGGGRSGPGGVLTVSNVPHVMHLVLDRPLPADVAGQVRGAASRASRLVMMNTATADFTCFLIQRLPFFTRTVRVTYRSIRRPAACGNRLRMCAGRP